MTREKQAQQVLHQELALDVYLKTLLDDVPEASEQLDEPQKAISSRPLATIETAAPIETVAPRIVRLQSAAPQLPVPVVVKHEPPQPVAEPKLQPLSVMPEWSRHEFQALFFKVDELILATPLTELLRTIKVVRKPTPIPGQPSWFLGLLDEHDTRIGVLDTGQLIFGKKRGALRDLEAKPFQRILITQDSRWGLACDEILAIGKVQPDKVRWRTNRQSKPWLIGTVIEELTAVIDVRALVPHRKRDGS